jgi:hypothetical protein
MEKLRQGPVLHLVIKGLDDDDDEYKSQKRNIKQTTNTTTLKSNIDA